MYTSHNRAYPDLLRAHYKSLIQRAARRAPATHAADKSRSTAAPQDQFAQYTCWEEGRDEDGFPPFVDPSEEQDLCVDPIEMLKIERSQYSSVTEITLCKKGITRLHSNIQLLECLDTLIIQHNRLREINFLLPPHSTGVGPRRGKSKNGGAVSDKLFRATRGCRLLRRLIASHNCIQTLEGDISRLRHLEVLHLAHNRLSNLLAVSAHLKPLRNLRILDLRFNPLCEEVGYRYFLIHKHPQIEVLDRHNVREDERKAAAEFFEPGGSALEHGRKGSHEFVSALSPRKSGSHAAAKGQTTPLQGPSPRAQHRQTSDAGSEGLGNALERPPVANNLPPVWGVMQKDGAASPFDGDDRKNPSKKIVFFSTYSPPLKAGDNAEQRTRVPFEPSSCERLLAAKIRNMKRDKARREIHKAHESASKRNELVECHKAFHTVWALSGKGMPLSAEMWETCSKQADFIIPIGSAADSPLATGRHHALKPRNSIQKQNLFETVVKSGGKQAPQSPCAVGRIKLPRLPSPMPGNTDHSMIFDSLLNRTDVLRARVWKENTTSEMRAAQLRQLNDVLRKASELTAAQAGDIKVGAMVSSVKQVLLAEEIQRQKDVFIPEPYQLTTGECMAGKASATERMEYLSHMAVVLFLPSELNTLESHFMPNAGDDTSASEQRGKRMQKKEKRPTVEAVKSSSGPNATSSLVSATTPPQRHHAVIMAATVELGPMDRSTVSKVINLLDSDSGIWQIPINSLTDAFRSEYRYCEPSEAKVITTPKSGGRGCEQSECRRPRRPSSKLRPRNERRSGYRPSFHRNEFRNQPQETDVVPALKPPCLMLGATLLDLVRYVPFVESRLKYFREMCANSVTQSIDSSAFTAQDWFSRWQSASWHLSRLLRALKGAGMSEVNQAKRLVPIDQLFEPEVREVGAFFTQRANSRAADSLST